jgi:hypothetical protein
MTDVGHQTTETRGKTVIGRGEPCVRQNRWIENRVNVKFRSNAVAWEQAGGHCYSGCCLLTFESFGFNLSHASLNLVYLLS